MHSQEYSERDLHLGVVLTQDVKLWRYMDFPKFVSLLENESLYFCRADLFSDPYEGSMTKNAVAFRESAWREHMANMPEEALKQFNAIHRFRLKEERKNFYINCWHMNEHESAAMWDLYGIKGQSIAIQSTYRTLRDAFPKNASAIGSSDEVHIDLGLVQYLDYDSDPMPQIYSFDPFLRKRKSFEHEREIRLFYQLPEKTGSYEALADGEYKFIPSDGVIEKKEPGTNFKVDLKALIHNLYVAPDSVPWLKDLIDKVLRRYGLDIECHQSNLVDTPVY